MCPSGQYLKLGEEARYVYHPEAWGQTRQPVVSESPQNHTALQRAFFIARLLSSRIEPACYALFPDGTVRNVAENGVPEAANRLRPSGTTLPERQP